MMKLMAIMQEELKIHLRSWAFYLTAVGMPLVFAAIGLLPQLQTAVQNSPLTSIETIFNDDETFLKPTGYVDLAGIITSVSGENFRPFFDEAAAAKALAKGQIESYFIIQADYPESGTVIEVSTNPQLISSTEGAIRRILRDSSLQALNNPDLAARLDDPLQFDRDGRPPPPVFSFIPTDLPAGTLTLAAMVVGLFAYLINIGGYLLVRSLKRETRARVLEVIVTSSQAWQFIGGKLLSLSTLALAQATATLLAGVFVYGRTPETIGPAALSISTLALILPYLFLGYLAYCGGVMSMATIWPNLPESATLLAMARLATLFPIVGVVFILPNANSSVSVILTTNPLTTTLLMPFRLLLTPVPFWQWAIGIIGLAGWTWFMVWVSIRLFRAHTLLTGQKFFKILQNTSYGLDPRKNELR